MTTSNEDFLNERLNQLLIIAERVRPHLRISFRTNGIHEILMDTIASTDSLGVCNRVASQSYSYLIISSDPQALILSVIKKLRDKNLPLYQKICNPVSVQQKLSEREYILTLGGNQLFYVAKTRIVSNNLLKALSCRLIASVDLYKNLIDENTLKLLPDATSEIHPLYDFTNSCNSDASGGRSKKHKKSVKKKLDIRTEMILQMADHVRLSPELSSGIIFDSPITALTVSVNIFFTDYKHKDDLVKYLHDLISSKYSNLSVKVFHHANFDIPNDFRIIKYAILLKEVKGKQMFYLGNLFNSATYDPLPCYLNDSLYISHPIVKLRLLYIELYLVECKLNKVASMSADASYYKALIDTYNDVLNHDIAPIWKGVYMNEQYDKNQYNIRNGTVSTFDGLYI